MKNYRVPIKGGIKLDDYDPNDVGEYEGGKQSKNQHHDAGTDDGTQ